jgi:hypothetical protein
MSQRAKAISKRIESFQDEVVAYVETLSGDDWKKRCAGEEWSVGVTARHLGAGHFAISRMLGMIVKGEALPPLTMEQINASSQADAEAHPDCTKTEALALLRENGAALSAFVAGLSDDDLDRKGDMPAFGGAVTTEQFIEFVIFQSAVQHFESMKTAVGA